MEWAPLCWLLRQISETNSVSACIRAIARCSRRFHFGKLHADEVLGTLGDAVVAVNISPVGHGHSLLVPQPSVAE